MPPHSTRRGGDHPKQPMTLTATLRSSLIVMALCLSATLAGCSAQVGDACLTSQECGTAGLCDTSSPDGYCTQTPCSPNGCPDEAVCVEFEGDQTFCMLRCEVDGDCRQGYACRADRGPIKFCYIQP